MARTSDTSGDKGIVSIINRNGPNQVVLICEHASNHIPDIFDQLGLSTTVGQSHVAWDPGAARVARHVSEMLDCPLIESRVSRLVYDCNRPADAVGAMPATSEIYDIPGNEGLTPAQKAQRVRDYYDPFHAAVNEVIATRGGEHVLVTVHSFTPVYNGRTRDVEIGILHDADSRLADAMMELAPGTTSMNVEYNQPYSAADGVTHTLKLHGISRGFLNVMLEIRNDLLETPEQIEAIAVLLARLLSDALSRLKVDGHTARTGT